MRTNRLYYGDNLDLLRCYIASESVEIVYLDPPFNSNATYNVLFQEKEGTAFGAGSSPSSVECGILMASLVWPDGVAAVDTFHAAEAAAPASN